MGIALDIIRQSEVDYVCQIVYVQTTRSHICSHQQLNKVVTELLHRQVTLLLTKVAMQRLGVIAIFYEFIGHLLCLHLGTTEDDGKYTWIVVYYAFQRQILILGVHHIIDVIHTLCALVAATYHYLLIVVQILLCHTLHLFTHGGREHQRVMIIRQRLEYLVDAIRETHVKHLIGLVKHYISYLLKSSIATMHQVNQSAWCGHNYLYTLLQGSHLWLYRSATINSLHMHTVHILGKVAQIISYLQA